MNRRVKEMNSILSEILNVIVLTLLHYNRALRYSCVQVIRYS